MAPFAEPLHVEPVGFVVAPRVVRLRLRGTALLTRLSLQTTRPKGVSNSPVCTHLLWMSSSPRSHVLGTSLAQSRGRNARTGLGPTGLGPHALCLARDARRVQSVRSSAVRVEERRRVWLHLPAASTRLPLPSRQGRLFASEFLHAAPTVFRVPRLETALLAARLNRRGELLVGRKVLPSSWKVTLAAPAPLRLDHSRSILQG